MENFPLGAKVQIQAHLKPMTVLDTEKKLAQKTWKRVKTSKKGVVVGVRSVKEGQIHWDYDRRFRPSRHIKVYLVAVAMNRILRVLPADLEECTEEETAQATDIRIPGQLELFTGEN
ncbi:MAG: hypothetical protein H0Z39_03405 [Peptococcaceae bacterium]|nr:hypothetical protein [Peptococcaceae bacterium]